MLNSQILENYLDNHKNDFSKATIDLLRGMYTGYQETDLIDRLCIDAERMMNNEKEAFVIQLGNNRYGVFIVHTAGVLPEYAIRASTLVGVKEFALNFNCTL